MLNNLKKLLVADIKRLKKYNIIQISIVLAFLYALIIYFTSKEEAESLILMLIFMDISMMSMIMLGASLFFEKQEGSLKSVMVAPVNFIEILLSKLLSTLFLNFLTAVIIISTAVLAHGAQVNIALLLLYACLGAAVHISLGFILVMISKDFNTMLFHYMIYVIVFTLPSFLLMANIIPSSIEFILFLSPSYSAQILLQTSLGVMPNLVQHIFSIFYSVAIIVCTYQFYIKKKFKEYVMRG